MMPFFQVLTDSRFIVFLASNKLYNSGTDPKLSHFDPIDSDKTKL